MLILPKVDLLNLHRNSESFCFCGTCQADSKFYMKVQRAKNNKDRRIRWEDLPNQMLNLLYHDSAELAHD